MKNLLERLKPEYLELLNEDAIKYPYMIESIKNTLLKYPNHKSGGPDKGLRSY